MGKHEQMIYVIRQREKNVAYSNNIATVFLDYSIFVFSFLCMVKDIVQRQGSVYDFDKIEEF